MTYRERPAHLFGDDQVLLTRRGVEICRSALLLAVRHAGRTNGSASDSSDVTYLQEVLRIAATLPSAPEPAEKQRVVVRISDCRPAGSANGSEVAEPASAGASSAARVVGRSGRLDTRAAAEILGVSDRAVRKACFRGTLSAAWVSGHWEIDPVDVRAYGQRRRARNDGGQTAATG